MKPGRARPAPRPCKACETSSISRFGAKICATTATPVIAAPQIISERGPMLMRGNMTSWVKSKASALAMKP